MKAKLALLAAIPLVAAPLFVSTPAVAQESTISVNAPLADDLKGTRNWFRLRCATCHGQNGEGTKKDWPQTGPALKGNPFVINAPPVAIARVIRKGREGRERLYHDTYPNMPAFGVEMLPNLEAMIEFLKTDLQK